MKTITNLKSTLTSTAAVLLFATSAQLSASDYRFWREQVPLNNSESRTVGVIGGEQGSWFLNEIVANHLEQVQEQKSQELTDVRTTSSSASQNWFIHAIAPDNYRDGTGTNEADTKQRKIALQK